MRKILLSLVLCALSLPAAAADGLLWRWPEGEVRRYHIKADVRLSEWLVLRKEANSDLRLAQFLVGVNTSCSPVARVGKRAWELDCKIDDVQFIGATTRADSGKLLPILDELDDKLVGASMQIIFGEDGRIRNVGLEGVDKSWRRAILMQETMRLMLTRAFASLELQLPKKGDAKGRSWKQKGGHVMAFPSPYGTMGLAETTHQVSKTKDGLVQIASKGRGVVGPGEMITVRPGEPERPKNLYDLRIEGVATFDTTSGTLVERQYLVQGEPTASSVIAEGGGGVHYVQAVRLVHVPAGQEMPPLGPNQEAQPAP